MSWNIDIDHKYSPDGINYTHNVNGMIRAAGMDWSAEAIRKMTCEQFAHEVRLVFKVWDANPDRFRAMNPENGWGSYDSLRAALEEFVDKCDYFPGCRLVAHF